MPAAFRTPGENLALFAARDPFQKREGRGEHIHLHRSAGQGDKAGNDIVTNKEPRHVPSICKGAKMPFFLRLNCGDFGMHQGVVTGSPVSHGCVRLPAAIARKWYTWQIEGPEMVWYFRGVPHIHAYFHLTAQG